MLLYREKISELSIAYCSMEYEHRKAIQDAACDSDEDDDGSVTFTLEDDLSVSDDEKGNWNASDETEFDEGM